MKNKELNTFSVESNNETITICTIQTDKGIVVSVKGTTMDVLVNDEEIYSKFNNPEYKNIPSKLRGFVEQNLCSWGDGINTKDDKVNCDIEKDCEEYYMQIPINKAKSKDIFISHWLKSFKKIQDNNVDIPDAEETFKKLIKEINDIGYKFEFAWDGNDYDDEYKLIIPIGAFDEAKVFECFKVWSDYNLALDKYIDEI